MQLATRVSITDTQEVSAAKPIIKKKAMAAILPTDPMAFKNLRQRNKDQAWAGSHSIGSQEDKYCRDDHHTSQESNTCVKYFNLISGFI